MEMTRRHVESQHEYALDLEEPMATQPIKLKRRSMPLLLSSTLHPKLSPGALPARSRSLSLTAPDAGQHDRSPVDQSGMNIVPSNTNLQVRKRISEINGDDSIVDPVSSTVAAASTALTLQHVEAAYGLYKEDAHVGFQRLRRILDDAVRDMAVKDATIAEHEKQHQLAKKAQTKQAQRIWTLESEQRYLDQEHEKVREDMRSMLLADLRAQKLAAIKRARKQASEVEKLYNDSVNLWAQFEAQKFRLSEITAYCMALRKQYHNTRTELSQVLQYIELAKRGQESLTTVLYHGDLVPALSFTDLSKCTHDRRGRHDTVVLDSAVSVSHNCGESADIDQKQARGDRPAIGRHTSILRSPTLKTWQQSSKTKTARSTYQNYQESGTQTDGDEAVLACTATPDLPPLPTIIVDSDAVDEPLLRSVTERRDFSQMQQGSQGDPQLLCYPGTDDEVDTTRDSSIETAMCPGPLATMSQRLVCAQASSTSRRHSMVSVSESASPQSNSDSSRVTSVFSTDISHSQVTDATSPNSTRVKESWAGLRSSSVSPLIQFDQPQTQARLFQSQDQDQFTYTHNHNSPVESNLLKIVSSGPQRLLQSAESDPKTPHYTSQPTRAQGSESRSARTERVRASSLERRVQQPSLPYLSPETLVDILSSSSSSSSPADKKKRSRFINYFLAQIMQDWNDFRVDQKDEHLRPSPLLRRSHSDETLFNRAPRAVLNSQDLLQSTQQNNRFSRRASSLMTIQSYAACNGANGQGHATAGKPPLHTSSYLIKALEASSKRLQTFRRLMLSDSESDEGWYSLLADEALNLQSKIQQALLSESPQASNSQENENIEPLCQQLKTSTGKLEDGFDYALDCTNGNRRVAVQDLQNENGSTTKNLSCRPDNLVERVHISSSRGDQSLEEIDLKDRAAQVNHGLDDANSEAKLSNEMQYHEQTELSAGTIAAQPQSSVLLCFEAILLFACGNWIVASIYIIGRYAIGLTVHEHNYRATTTKCLTTKSRNWPPSEAIQTLCKVIHIAYWLCLATLFLATYHARQQWYDANSDVVRNMIDGWRRELWFSASVLVWSDLTSGICGRGFGPQLILT